MNGYFADAPNSLFENRGGLQFADVAPSAGVALRDAGRGLAVFDADGDGRPDVLATSVSGAPRLYANRTASGTWIAVELVGEGANRDGLGAIVEVEAGGRRWVRSHHGVQFLGQSAAPVHVGLGTSDAVDLVRVRWPGGGVEEVPGLAVDQRVVIQQGVGLVDGRAVPLAEGPLAVRGLQLSAGPNPSRGFLRLRVGSPVAGLAQLTLTDVTGRVVRRAARRVRNGFTELVWDLNGRERIASGSYVLTVVGPSGATSFVLTFVTG